MVCIVITFSIVIFFALKINFTFSGKRSFIRLFFSHTSYFPCENAKELCSTPIYFLSNMYSERIYFKFILKTIFSRSLSFNFWKILRTRYYMNNLQGLIIDKCLNTLFFPIFFADFSKM